MPAHENLQDMYVGELSDLWSANEQMTKVVEEMADVAEDAKLAERLRRSAEGIQKHSELLQDLLDEIGAERGKEHCKGMEGLVQEARKHAVEANLSGAVRDVAVIAQYQRMCHYGIAGFGTAKAYAEALGRSQDAIQLDEALEKIYESDDYFSELAQRSKNLKAA